MTTLRQQMTQDLQIAGLSERTQEAYLRAVRQLADHYGEAPDGLAEQQVRDYFLFLNPDYSPRCDVIEKPSRDRSCLIG